mgnify:CR=1 FL=1
MHQYVALITNFAWRGHKPEILILTVDPTMTFWGHNLTFKGHTLFVDTYKFGLRQSDTRTDGRKDARTHAQRRF